MRHVVLSTATVTVLLSAMLLGVATETARGEQTQTFVRPPVRDPSHTAQRRIWSWKELQERNIVIQKRDFSCGAAALATVGKYYWGDEVTETYFLELLDSVLTTKEALERIENGLALTDLRRAAVKAGYTASIGRVSFTKLREAKLPVVVGIIVDEYDHFAVFRGADGYNVYLADPIRGNIRIPIPTFLCQWQENAILVVVKPGESIRSWSPLSIRQSERCEGTLTRKVVRDHALLNGSVLPTPTR